MVICVCVESPTTDGTSRSIAHTLHQKTSLFSVSHLTEVSYQQPPAVYRGAS